MIRIDFKGLPSGCTSSLGIENSQIPDSQMTSSSSSDSSHTASRGRLYGSSSWCSSTTSNTEYIQVDLGQTKTVTGIATQGDNSLNKWVTSYKVSYSFDNGDWNEYKDGQVAKVFSGNSNKNDVIVNWFNRPIAARYVRILPHTSSGGHCLRLDLYGCAVFVIPKVILDTAQVILPASKGTNRTLSCSVLGEPTPDIQWFNNGTKINGATQPTLQVQFISAEDVLSKSNCKRQDPRTRAVVCNTFYTCRIVNPVELPSGGINEATGKVTVNLNVPEAPNLTASPYKRSITIRWTAVTAHNDVGHIISYTVQLNKESTVVTYPVQHPAVNYSLEYLKPYTSYRIRMNAISSVGQGLWSSWMNVTTLIDERRTTEYTNSTLWALQGDEITIGCYTSGDESITYFWTKTGSLIVDSSVAKARGSDLIISLESDKDFGTYVCNATNSERTVVYRINKVELKKYSTCKFNGNTDSQSKAKEIVPYVIPLALINLLLIICIVYLVYRLRKDKKHYQERIDKKMDDITNEKTIKNDVINQSRYPDDAIQFQRRQPRKPDSAKANKIEHPTYMELKPTQDNNSIYQEPLNKPRKTASPQMQGTGHGEYMDLKPRENTGYETLHHQNLVRAKDYETINNRGFYKNVSIDDTEV